MPFPQPEEGYRPHGRGMDAQPAGQGQAEQPVSDAAAKGGGPGEFRVGVDGLTIASQVSEREDILCGDNPFTEEPFLTCEPTTHR